MTILQPPLRPTPKVLNDLGNDLDKNFKAILDRYYLSAIPPIYLGGGQQNVIKISAGGELQLLGTTTVWDDLRVEPTVRGTGAKAPSYVAYKSGIYAYEFDNAALSSEKEVNFKLQLPHAWKAGSDIHLHIHWTAGTTGLATQKIRWGLEYTKASVNGVFGATTTIYATDPSNPPSTTPTADTHYLTTFDNIAMTGNELSTIVLCRLFRNSSHESDSYTGSAFLISIDAHIEIDSIGSKDVFTK